jgi:putative NIF3 family GTP cyclohydrolase 1 type 2
MAFQLIYTSASAALKPGVTGFATVAQHRGIRAAIVRAIEQRSGYLDSAAHGGKRPAVFAFRRIEAAGERAYVLTRVVASGADYTGRNNHLAHHLVVAESELEHLRVSPADVMRQMRWRDKWDEEPRYFTEADEIKLSEMQPQLSLPAKKWAAWSKGGSWDPACAALPFSNTESKDARSFFAVADVEDTGRLLDLYGESLLLKDPDRSRPALLWQTPFTTLEIQAEDAQEFQWIGCVHGSPRHVELLKQKRSILDLTAVSLTPPSGELAELARNPARAARKAPDIEQKAGGAARSAEHPDLPRPAVPEQKAQRRDKKRDYEKEMLARIEGADVDEKSLRERLMPLVIGVAVIFLGLVAWQVYQEVSTNKKKAQERVVRLSVQGMLQQLEQSFKQGNDVSTQAHDLRDNNKDYAALPEKDALKTQLDELIQRHEAWFALRSEVQEHFSQQALLNPADKEKLSQLKARLVVLPKVIQDNLSKQVDTLITEQMSIKTILDAKEKGVNPRDEGKKIELAGFANNQYARAEVRDGLLKIVVALFPPPPEEKPKPKPKDMVAAKSEPPPPPKVKDIVTDSNPGIALLQRLPETHVVPRSELRVSYAAIGPVKQAVGVLTAEDASGSPSVSVAEAGSGPEPAGGVLNALDGGAKFTTYRIAGTNVYAQGSQLLMNFSAGSVLDLKSGAALPWKPDARYLFSFSQSKPDASGVPPVRFPDLRLLSMPPAPSKEEALKLPPLLVLSAADFLSREGTRIVIKPGGSPDLRKLLGKMVLAVGTEPGTSFSYEFEALAAPMLKRSDGSLPAMLARGTVEPTALWTKLGLELSAEILRPDKARHQIIQRELGIWRPLVAGMGLLRPSIPADYTTLLQAVTDIRRGGKGEPEWVKVPFEVKGNLPGNTHPGLVLEPTIGRSAIVTYLDLVCRVMTMLESTPHIYFTAEDRKLKQALQPYTQQSTWISNDAWTTVVDAYTALLAAVPPTNEEEEKEREKAKKQPPRRVLHRWENREALLRWFSNTLNPAVMQQAKEYLMWVPASVGIDPAARLKKAEDELQIWLQDEMVADLLEKAPPEKLSVRYTLLVIFPFTFPNTQKPAGAYLKWVEFTGQPEAAPAIPPAPNNNKP